MTSRFELKNKCSDYINVFINGEYLNQTVFCDLILIFCLFFSFFCIGKLWSFFFFCLRMAMMARDFEFICSIK